MNSNQEMQGLYSLNRAFQRAFKLTETGESLETFLACVGQELDCERISIFEMNIEGTCDNTFEWCRDPENRIRELFHGISGETFEPLTALLKERDPVCIRDIRELEDDSKGFHALLEAQKIQSIIISRLAFHGHETGFVMIEDPSINLMDDAAVVIPGLRYILSSLVHNEHLSRRLSAAGYRDHLTGIGNIALLKERIQEQPEEKPISVFYVEVLGWDENHHAAEFLKIEQALIRVGEVLAGMFGEENVFRAAPREFLASQEGDLQLAQQMKYNLRCLMEEHGVLCGIGMDHQERLPRDREQPIRNAHAAAHHEIPEILRTQPIAGLDGKAEKAAGSIAGLAAADAAGDGTGPAAEAAAGKAAAGTEASGLAAGSSDTEGEHFGAFHPDSHPDSGWADEERAKIDLPRGNDFFRKAAMFREEINHHSMIAVVVDLNYFRLFNDIFGRRAGSRFLESIAGNVRKQADRLQGICGYLGGDNFILIFPPDHSAEDEPQAVIEELYRNLPYPDGFSPALGVYLSTDPEEPVSAMYDHALSALQQIKGSYIEHYHFYDPEHFLRERDDQLLLMDVRDGLANDEFYFYLQPQVNEKNGRIVGAEALCRWEHKGSMVGPGQFIPTLEKTGMIFDMDKIIWEKVAVWMKSLQERGLPVIPVSVNVSRVDFHFTDIAQHFIDLMKRYDLDPSLIAVEITETAFGESLELLTDAVNRLHDAGFSVYMDDFGSGYSSLSMLRQINVDAIKTDVGFMTRRDSDARAMSIVESVISMAHLIGMLVITEGIETEEQRENLISMGERYAQGFLFYRPMSVEQFEELIRDPEKLGIPLRQKYGDAMNQLQFREMVGAGMLSESLLDSLIGAAAIFRREGDRLTILQSNEPYRRMSGQDEDGAYSAERVIVQNRETLLQLFDKADMHPEGGAEGAISMHPEQGASTDELTQVDAKVFTLYTCEDHTIYIVSMQ